MQPNPLVVAFPEAFVQLTGYCEVTCVAGCCGLDAFEFDRETIRSAIDHMGVEATKAACLEALAWAAPFESLHVACQSSQAEFNHVWETGTDLHSWTTHIALSFMDVLSEPNSASP